VIFSDCDFRRCLAESAAITLQEISALTRGWRTLGREWSEQELLDPPMAERMARAHETARETHPRHRVAGAYKRWAGQIGSPEPFSRPRVGCDGYYLTFPAWRVTLGGRLVSRGGLPGLNIRSGWGRASCCRRSAQSGFLGEGAGSKRMLGNGVRVVPVGTDVMGVFVLSERVVCRCVSTADSSLSLSLSLLAIS
jgi:hypothetical protein